MGFAIYVGDKSSLTHGVQVHGPGYMEMICLGDEELNL